jgi:hypothetical protein
MAMLRRRGYEFVSIERAVADPAYQSPDHYYGSRGFSWLHRWAMTTGKPRSFFAGAPALPPDVKRVH